MYAYNVAVRNCGSISRLMGQSRLALCQYIFAKVCVRPLHGLGEIQIPGYSVYTRLQFLLHSALIWVSSSSQVVVLSSWLFCIYSYVYDMNNLNGYCCWGGFPLYCSMSISSGCTGRLLPIICCFIVSLVTSKMSWIGGYDKPLVTAIVRTNREDNFAPNSRELLTNRLSAIELEVESASLSWP